MVDPKYLDPNEYWAQPSNTHQRAYLVKMGVRIHNLLVDIKELLVDGKLDHTRGLPPTVTVGKPSPDYKPSVSPNDNRPRANNPVSTKPFVRPA